MCEFFINDMEIEFADITYYGLVDIIDSHLVEERDLHIVCDSKLKDLIKNYMFRVYNIEPEVPCPKGDEFYIEIMFFDSKISFFVEKSKSIKGGYKTCDYIDDIDYIIFTDMSIYDVSKCFFGKNAKYIFAEFVEYDFDDDDGYEDCCNYYDFEDGYYEYLDCHSYEKYDTPPELDLISQYFDEFVKFHDSPSKILSLIEEVYNVGKDIGYEDCRLEIADVVSDLEK